MWKLPTNYTNLTLLQRREVRNQYIEQQSKRCMYCNNFFTEKPPKEIDSLFINWILFPESFRNYPIHLQHCHKTNMTEGAVHMKCNAVLWQYEGR